MSTEWTPPTYMHKAKSSGTSFLSEKKRITGKMLKKPLKPIQKHKTTSNIMDYSKSPKSSRSPRSPRSPKKNKMKKIKSQNNVPSSTSEPQTETILQSLANEYESSDSETDCKQQPERQLVLQSVIEEDLEIHSEAVVEDDIHCMDIIESNDEPQFSFRMNSKAETPIIITEFTFDDSKKDQQPSHANQCKSDHQSEPSDSNSAQLNIIEAVSETEANAEPESETKLESDTPQETILEAESKENIIVESVNESGHVLGQLSIMSSETEPGIDIETEATIDVEVEAESVSQYSVDETSLLSILKTLNYECLDKDGNGRISRNYFRYYFRSKIKKQINDKHVLKIFQNINKNGSSYVSVAEIKAWKNKMTSFRLEQILRNKLMMHKQYKSANDIPEYIDQTSLLSFLKTINIKNLNDENGYIKIFDFGLYFNRNYKKQVTDIDDIFENIYYDVNHNHNGRMTNDEFNKWVKNLNQMHLDKVLATKLTQSNHKWLISILKKLNPKILDENNMITIASFKQYFKTLNKKNMDESIITKIFYNIDKDHTGTFTIDSYLKWKDCLNDDTLKQIMFQK